MNLSFSFHDFISQVYYYLGLYNLLHLLDKFHLNYGSLKTSGSNNGKEKHLPNLSGHSWTKKEHLPLAFILEV